MTDTAIGWTDQVWNPVTGCSKVSEGCRNCYAETISLRYGRSQHPWSAQFASENVVLHPDRLGAPLKWKKPSRCFVNSMSDLFHPLVPFEYIARVWDVMFEADRHTFQILTKRPERMVEFAQWMNDHEHRRIDYPNVWLGTSVENQDAADERIPHLLNTPAAVRFLSCEPLLGRVTLWAWDEDEGALRGPGVVKSGGMTVGTADYPPEGYDDSYAGIDWVIVGGESGPKHRPMDLPAALDIVDQCVFAGVPTYVKQDSGMYPGRQGRIPDAYWVHEWPESPAARAAVQVAP